MRKAARLDKPSWESPTITLEPAIVPTKFEPTERQMSGQEVLADREVRLC